MKITSFVKAAVFAATFMAVSASATAAVQTLGVINSPLKTFNGGVFGSGQPTPIVFTDQLTFTLLASSSTMLFAGLGLMSAIASRRNKA